MQGQKSFWMTQIVCCLFALTGGECSTEVATLFSVSPSRISHIQGIMERKKLDERERTVMEICKIKK